MRETKIDFIRHTRLRDVDGTFCYGASDLDVAESFREEAESVRRALRGVPTMPPSPVRSGAPGSSPPTAAMRRRP